SALHDELLLPYTSLPWHPLDKGIDFQHLYSSLETGRWTVLLRCQPDSVFGKHKHLGAGEYYVVKGAMEYRMGRAEVGTYGYEPIGVIHERTHFPEYTELFFTNYGPVVFLDEAGSVASVLD